jgi:hypothetical protein
MSEIVLQGFLMKKKNEISASKAEEIRNQNISAQIYASISSAILGGGSVDAIKNSIQQGFREGKTQVENLENGLEYRSEYFQHGDPDSISRILQIESDPNFDKWIDEIAIAEIKLSISDFRF